MKIGLVLHGPEVIDSGEAKMIIEKLSCLGKVEAQLGGTMGRTAVLDARLEDVIDISRHLKPSVVIESFFEAFDLVCLLNRGKTIETGRVFGKMVAARVKDLERKPLLHIESPESAFGELIALNKKAGEHLEKLSEVLGLPAKIPQPLENSIDVENCTDTGKTRVIRRLSGVFPGENILVNGLVIGKAHSSEISIVSENGLIIAIKGGEIKEHGIEKLHNYEERTPIDLAKAWVKSGDIRRSNSFTLQTEKQNTSPQISDFPSMPRTGKVVLIDHIAEYTFELAAGADLAVTVGDDTTAIAGDILCRLGIPILGITDGDCDNLTCRTDAYQGSIVIRVASEKDDIVGKKLKHELFGGENSTNIEDVNTFKKVVLKLAEHEIEAIVEY